jgi:hypothetical protein
MSSGGRGSARIWNCSDVPSTAGLRSILFALKTLNERCSNVLGRFIQQPIVQTGPERQRLGPSSHILDKRLPVPETRPNLVPQEERGNASSFARRAHLHRSRRISYNATTSREVCWDDTSWLAAESIRRRCYKKQQYLNASKSL